MNTTTSPAPNKAGGWSPREQRLVEFHESTVSLEMRRNGWAREWKSELGCREVYVSELYGGGVGEIDYYDTQWYTRNVRVSWLDGKLAREAEALYQIQSVIVQRRGSERALAWRCSAELGVRYVSIQTLVSHAGRIATEGPSHTWDADVAQHLEGIALGGRRREEGVRELGALLPASECGRVGELALALADPDLDVHAGAHTISGERLARVLGEGIQLALAALRERVRQ